MLQDEVAKATFRGMGMCISSHPCSRACWRLRCVMYRCVPPAAACRARTGANVPQRVHASAGRNFAHMDWRCLSMPSPQAHAACRHQVGLFIVGSAAAPSHHFTQTSPPLASACRTRRPVLLHPPCCHSAQPPRPDPSTTNPHRRLLGGCGHAATYLSAPRCAPPFPPA